LEKKNNLWSIFGGDITHITEIPVRRSSGVDDQCFKSICNWWKCLFKSRICVAKVFMLQRSVLSDLKDDNIYQEIVALAIIGKIITTPFMKLVDSKTFATHILDLNKHFHQLQIDLKIVTSPCS
jgi:hypothetical protein